MGRIERTEVDDRRPTTNGTKMKTMMLTTWMMLCLLLIGACAPAAPATEDAPAAPAADAGDQGASGAVDSAETAEKPETIGEDCLPNENNEFVFKVSLWEYQYEVEGCEGVAPTLKIKRGVEYTFVQEDVSNWYHPLGLAYYPDGAHDGVPELEEPTPAECDEEDYMCNPGEGVQQAPLYCINNNCETYEYLAAIAIRGNFKFDKKRRNHRHVLGSILGLGIDRKILGDIIIPDEGDIQAI